MSDSGETTPACDTVSPHVIPTERVGALSVWVQGDLSLAQNKESRDNYCVFLTVHDVGVNHNAWLKYVNSAPMAQIREKAIFIHVDLVGQEDGAEDLEGNFPSMQEIGEDLVNILDTLRVKCVVGIGEGAGANIMLRFGAMHVTRCLGVICINPNPSATTFMEGIMVCKQTRIQRNNLLLVTQPHRLSPQQLVYRNILY
jgi:protein NDRG1